MARLQAKSTRLTGYLDFLLTRLPAGFCTVVTPKQPEQRGAQLSLRLNHPPKPLVRRLAEAGVVCDFREPDIIRVAPAPLYCNFEDVFRFVQVLEKEVLSHG